MNIILYYVDGSRSERTDIGSIVEMADGTIYITDMITGKAEYFNSDHIALMSVRKDD